MKQLLLLLLCFVVCTKLSAQTVIENPSYESRNSGVLKITKVERNVNNTRVHIRCTYTPNWWVSINSNITLKESYGERRYKATGIEGGEFNKRAVTPKSGYQDFVIIFEPIGEDIELIDFIEPSGWSVFDIDVSGKSDSSDMTQLPHSLKGSWSDTKGVDGWKYGLYDDIAIIDGRYWEYSEIKKIRKGYRVTLSCENESKELYIYPNNKLLAIGETKGAKKATLYTTDAPRYVGTDDITKNINPLQGGEVVVKGFIDGYSPKLGFKTALLYSDDCITGADNQVTINIGEDGRFEFKFNTEHIAINFIRIGDNRSFRVLAMPQDTITYYIDWDKMIESDCHPHNRLHEPDAIRTMGRYSRLSDELNTLKVDNLVNRSPIYDRMRRVKIVPFFESIKKDYSRDSLLLEKMISENGDFMPISLAVARTSLLTLYFDMLCTYTMSVAKRVNKEEEGITISTTVVDGMPEDYWSILKKIDISNSRALLLSDFDTFVNRYEFMPGVKFYNTVLSITDMFYELAREGKLPIPEEDRAEIERIGSSKGSEEDQLKFSEIFSRNRDALQRAIDTHLAEEIYTASNRMKFEDTKEMSRLYWGDSSEILSDIVIARDLSSTMQGMQKDGARVIKEFTKGYIESNDIRRGIERSYDMIHNRSPKFIIPEGEAKEYFKSLIAPYKGRYIFIDFWATSCGPCVYGIEKTHELRDKLKDRRVEFIFITDEASSPISAYNKYMNKTLGTKLRITSDEWNLLAGIFNISAIPRYILVNDKGEVVDDSASWYELEDALNEAGM